MRLIQSYLELKSIANSLVLRSVLRSCSGNRSVYVHILLNNCMLESLPAIKARIAVAGRIFHVRSLLEPVTRMHSVLQYSNNTRKNRYLREEHPSRSNKTPTTWVSACLLNLNPKTRKVLWQFIIYHSCVLVCCVREDVRRVRSYGPQLHNKWILAARSLQTERTKRRGETVKRLKKSGRQSKRKIPTSKK